MGKIELSEQASKAFLRLTPPPPQQMDQPCQDDCPFCAADIPKLAAYVMSKETWTVRPDAPSAMYSIGRHIYVCCARHRAVFRTAAEARARSCGPEPRLLKIVHMNWQEREVLLGEIDKDGGEIRCMMPLEWNE